MHHRRSQRFVVGLRYIDGIATLVLLGVFAVMSTVKSHLKTLCILLGVSAAGMAALAFVGARHAALSMPATAWLFMQTFCIDIAYLSFQTIFFERFIACFKIRGNVGFFIITIDFIGYVGTLALLMFKELGASNVDWAVFYNQMSIFIGVACCVMFIGALVYMLQAEKAEAQHRRGRSRRRTTLRHGEHG